jgi:hypothetical protein
MSKGSSPRPYSVSQKEFGINYDAIFRKPTPSEIDDAVAEDEAFKVIEEQQKSQVRDSDQGG